MTFQGCITLLQQIHYIFVNLDASLMKVHLNQKVPLVRRKCNKFLIKYLYHYHVHSICLKALSFLCLHLIWEASFLYLVAATVVIHDPWPLTGSDGAS